MWSKSHIPLLFLIVAGLLFVVLLWSFFKPKKTQGSTAASTSSKETALQNIKRHPALPYYNKKSLFLANRDTNADFAIITPRYGALSGNPLNDTWKMFTPDTIIKLRNPKTLKVLQATHDMDQTLVNYLPSSYSIPDNETAPSSSNYVKPYTWKVESSPFQRGAIRLKNTHNGLYLGYRNGRYDMIKDDQGRQTSLFATTSNFIFGQDTNGICLFEPSAASVLHGFPENSLHPWSPVLVSLSESGDFQSGTPVIPRPCSDIHNQNRMDLCKWEIQNVAKVQHNPIAKDDDEDDFILSELAKKEKSRAN